MTEPSIPDSWWLLSRATGVGVVVRLLIVCGPLAALACVFFAADSTVLAINLAVVGLALTCAMLPDSHLGLLVVILVGTEWLIAVDAPATPWSIGAAVSLLVFHAAMAAAGVIPPAARWTRAMVRRWVRRSMVAMGASAVTWIAVVVLHDRDVPRNSALVATALLVLAAAGAAGARPAAATPPG